MGNINSRSRVRNCSSLELSSGSRERNWSSLELQILVLVARKIKRIEDFFAFRAVCVSWRSAATKDNFNGTHQNPWLVEVQEKSILLHGPRHRNGGYIMQNTPILKAENIKRCCLGWKGWVLVDEKDGNMYLLHVFSQIPIRLPNKNSVKNRKCCGIFADKAALSSNPSTTPSDYTLMIGFHSSLIAFWRPGDESFMEVQFPDYEDMICYNGLFYVVRKCGSITVFDVKGTKLTNLEIVGIPRLGHLDIGGHNGLYLVESAGELLIVARLILKEGLKFHVFVLIQNEWWEVVNIGRRAIFIGRNTSFSVNASEIPGCLPGHIHYTDHDQFHFPKRHHMGIYSLSKRKVVYSSCDEREKICACFRAHLWLTPALF